MSSTPLRETFWDKLLPNPNGSMGDSEGNGEKLNDQAKNVAV